MKSLSKKNLILLAVGGLLLICVFWSFSTYNGLVGQDEVVTTAWGNVQTQYQRRSDLIPNLVNVVKRNARSRCVCKSPRYADYGQRRRTNTGKITTISTGTRATLGSTWETLGCI